MNHDTSRNFHRFCSASGKTFALCAGLLFCHFSNGAHAAASDVTSETLGTPRTDGPYYVGCQFTTGAAPLTVTQLGRWTAATTVSGSTYGETHTLEIIDPANGNAVVGSVALTTAPEESGVFAYRPLSSPVTLAANHAYYLLSSETGGADTYYDSNTTLVSTSDVTIDNPEFEQSGTYHMDVSHGGLPNQCYGPVSFIYNHPSAVTSTTVGTARNDWGDYVGFKLTVGNAPLIVTQLGRWTSSGNSMTHTIEVVDAWNNNVVATASVDTFGAPAGQYLYGSVGSSPVTLSANHSYYLLSLESNGGDSWYQADTIVVPSGDLTIDNPEYHQDGIYYTNSDFGLANHSFGPVDFVYTLGEPNAAAAAISGAMLGRQRTDGPWCVGFKFTTGSNPLTVNQLGRWVSASNNHGQTHTVELVDDATQTVLTSVPVSTSGATPGQFAYAALTTPYTLAANHAYYILSHESGGTGADAWYDGNSGLITTGDFMVNNPEYYNYSDSMYHGDTSDETANNGYGPVSFTYTIPSVVDGVTLGTRPTRNAFGSYVGFKFTTNDTPLVVSHLGRWVLSGNSGLHALEIVDGSSPHNIVASTVVATSGATAGQFVYAPLDAAVTLSANHTYYLLSLERDGGDQWYDYDTVLTPSADISVNCAEFEYQGSYNDDASTFPETNHTYGPVSFIYQRAQADTWTLQTDDTLMTLSALGAPIITQLAVNSTCGLDWMATPSVVPLVRQVTDASSVTYLPNWTLASSSVNNDAPGTQVTLTYTSTAPALTLTQVWWARPGVGPVEETSTLANNNPTSSITVNNSDIVCSDVTVTPEAGVTPTLWEFSRSSVNDGSAAFSAGVLQTSLGASTSLTAVVSDDPHSTSYSSGYAYSGSYVLPFQMFDATGVRGEYGLYLGYENDFGLLTTVGTSDPATSPLYKIRNVASMWNANSITVAGSSTVALPAMFFGTYSGDTDTGSNHMKKWFWSYNIPASLAANANEPLVEVAAPLDENTSADILEVDTFFSGYPDLGSSGVESVKEDSRWSDDWNRGYPGNFGWDWSPAYLGHPSSYNQWPDGFVDGAAVHGIGLRFVLYMANTYQGADLATAAGISSEETALKARFQSAAASLSDWTGYGSYTSGYGFDTWRTDIDCEAAYDYLSHLGFEQVLDDMIAYSSDFRWENCSSGGSKKSFDLLRRQSYMCTEDSGANGGAVENYRMSYYASSYMINPGQLQAQNVIINDPSSTTAEANYEFRIGFLGAWMNYLYPGTSIQDSLYFDTVSIYRSQQRPIIRGADVYHILPIYSASTWDGIELFNPGVGSYGQGSVLLFKPKTCTTDSPVVYLKGLSPTNHYTLSFADRTSLNGISRYTNALGSTLMSGGTGIGSLTGNSGDYDSEIIWITQDGIL